MSNAELTFDRVMYRDGQRLAARDLSDDHGRETRLRRLHTRYLHETWGIAIGLEVQAMSASAVAVGPGYALDHRGRELVLATGLSLPVPSIVGPKTLVLVATFLTDGAFVSCSNDDRVCLDAPLNPGRERPAFAWVTGDELEPGPMVPLCHVVVQNGQIQGAIGTRVRRYARRLVRPHIATGVTDADRDQWIFGKWWTVGLMKGIEQRVDTADACFAGTPLYFAEVVVAKPASRPAEEMAPIAAQLHGHIAQTAVDSFVFRLIVHENFFLDVIESCAISWVGVEPLGGCPPSFDLRRLLTLAGLFVKVS